MAQADSRKEHGKNGFDYNNPGDVTNNRADFNHPMSLAFNRLPATVIAWMMIAILQLDAAEKRAAPDAATPSGWPDDSKRFQGRYIYERNCIVCHGKWGDGDGEMSKGMFPRPRPFTSGIFKYRTTPAGSLPTNSDLFHTVRNGLSGTSMPAFAQLRDAEIQAVVEYIKSFSPRWQERANYAAPLPAPKEPDWMDDKTSLTTRAARGKEHFMTACTSCHGEKGDGKGTAAAELKDAWNNPAPPPDLRTSMMRTGGTAGDIYRVLLAGVDGTPMPAFNTAFNEEQRWEIVAWVLTLRPVPGASP